MKRGREVRKSADHPNKTRDMICLDDSDNDEDEENEQNLNNNSVLLERLTKTTEVHETISVSPTINSGTVKEFLTDLGLGILKDRENGIVIQQNGRQVHRTFGLNHGRQGWSLP